MVSTLFIDFQLFYILTRIIPGLEITLSFKNMNPPSIVWQIVIRIKKKYSNKYIM
jgi:hypothetical protein